jgi:MbtH protein
MIPPGLIVNAWSASVTNSFENVDGRYVVLVNDEGQYSLWPETIDVPGGWSVVFGPDRRQPCLDHVEAVWVDMRPASLVAAMKGARP